MLPSGAKVTWVRAGKAASARIVGTEERDGTRHLLLRGTDGETLMTEAGSLCLRLATDEDASARTASKSLEVPPLGRYVFDAGVGLPVAALHRRLCALVGVKEALKKDLGTPCFGRAGEQCGYPLQQIVRAQGAGEVAGGVLTAIHAGSGKVPTGGSQPGLVIFDGANAYCRLGHGWPVSHHVVLVDQSDRRADDAVTSLRRALATRLDRAPDLNELADCPPTVEIGIFRDATG